MHSEGRAGSGEILCLHASLRAKDTPRRRVSPSGATNGHSPVAEVGKGVIAVWVTFKKNKEQRSCLRCSRLVPSPRYFARLLRTSSPSATGLGKRCS